MKALDLRILVPACGAAFCPPHDVIAPSCSVDMQGVIHTPTSTPLIKKWYASLELAPPLPGSNALAFTAELGRGTQLLTFTAKDVDEDLATDKLTALRAVTEGGFAGGAPSSTNPRGCAIHVLIAEPVWSLDVVELSRANATLKVIAPAIWDDAHYQKINGIHFVWRFEPLGVPDGRATVRLPPLPPPGRAEPPFPELAMRFSQNDAAANGRPTLTYEGPLPVGLEVDGCYRVVTRAETRDHSAAHEVARTVKITS